MCIKNLKIKNINYNFITGKEQNQINIDKKIRYSKKYFITIFLKISIYQIQKKKAIIVKLKKKSINIKK